MGPCYYYAFDDSLPACAVNACSKSSDEYPLIVNCTGVVNAVHRLTTDNAQGREDYYLIYMKSGSMDVWLGDGVYRAKSGDVIIFPPHYHYRYTYSGGEQLTYMWVHFTGSYAKRFLLEVMQTELPTAYSTCRDSRIAGGFCAMFDIFESGGALRDRVLACALERLILTAAESRADSDSGRGFEKSLRYIHSSYDRDIRIETLAAMENLSYSGYIKLFRQKNGMPPAAYIINLRMNAACDLLMNTDMSVKQVGIAVGYPDAHFFSRLFKKHTGKSPREYRNGV